MYEAVVGDVGIDLRHVWAVCKKSATVIEVAALQAGRELFRQRFALTDMDDSEAAEIPIFRAEWSVDDGYVLNEFRTESFERSEISLAVTLGSLILLNVVDEYFQAAVDAAVVEVEPETTDLGSTFRRLRAGSVNPGVQLLEDLVVAGEQRSVEDLGVTQIDGRLNRSRRDHYTLTLGFQFGEVGCLSGSLA